MVTGPSLGLHLSSRVVLICPSATATTKGCFHSVPGHTAGLPCLDGSGKQEFQQKLFVDASQGQCRERVAGIGLWGPEEWKAEKEGIYPGWRRKLQPLTAHARVTGSYLTAIRETTKGSLFRPCS